MCHVLSIATLAFVLFVGGFAGLARANSEHLTALADSIGSLEIDPSMQAEVANLSINRGGVKFNLIQGTLTLGKPVAGRLFSVDYVGKGSFELTPPNRAERHMLVRHTQDSTANWEFDDVAFLFTDSTFQELASQLTFKSLGPGKDELRLQQGFINYIEHEFDMSFSALILSDMLQPQLGGRFMARFTAKRGNFVFFYDPKEVEEIQLYKHVVSEAGSGPDLIQSFHTADEYKDSPWGADRENHDLIDSLDYDISCKIYQSAKTDLDVKFSFICNIDSLRAVTFQLMPDIDYNSLSIH
ncbi:MAG: hypothetical protein WBP29_07355, partial [Candidatus Zixiibacteriota bacterium]